MSSVSPTKRSLKSNTEKGNSPSPTKRNLKSISNKGFLFYDRHDWRVNAAYSHSIGCSASVHLKYSHGNILPDLKAYKKDESMFRTEMERYCNTTNNTLGPFDKRFTSKPPSAIQKVQWKMLTGKDCTKTTLTEKRIWLNANTDIIATVTERINLYMDSRLCIMLNDALCFKNNSIVDSDEITVWHYTVFGPAAAPFIRSVGEFRERMVEVCEKTKDYMESYLEPFCCGTAISLKATDDGCAEQDKATQKSRDSKVNSRDSKVNAIVDHATKSFSFRYKCTINFLQSPGENEFELFKEQIEWKINFKDKTYFDDKTTEILPLNRIQGNKFIINSGKHYGGTDYSIRSYMSTIVWTKFKKQETLSTTTGEKVRTTIIMY